MQHNPEGVNNLIWWINHLCGRGPSHGLVAPLLGFLVCYMKLSRLSLIRGSNVVWVCKLVFVPCPKPTLLWMTLWRCPQLPTLTSQAYPLLVPTLPIPLMSLISLFGPSGFASEGSLVRVGHRRHIWETAAGVCSVPSPRPVGNLWWLACQPAPPL